MFVIATSCGSCSLFRREPPAPFVAPPAAVQFGHFAGTPLSGPTARQVTLTGPESALGLRVRLYAIERAPVALGSPLGAQAKTVVVTRGGEPVLSTGRLTESARLLDLDAAHPLKPASEPQLFGRVASIADVSGALAPETSAVLSASEPLAGGAVDPVLGTTAERRLDLYVYRLPNAPGQAQGKLAIELAVVVQDQYTAPLPIQPPDTGGPATKPSKSPNTAPATTQGAAAPQPAAAEAHKPAKPVLVREMALVDRARDGETMGVAILLPLRFSGSTAQGVVAVIDVTAPSNDPQHARAVAQAQQDLANSAAAVAARPSIAPVGASTDASINVAVASLENPQRCRAALVYLATQGGAALAENAALVADDAALAKLTAGVTSGLAAAPRPLPPDVLGWVLDRATFDLLGAMLAAGDLPPELASVLASFAGEAGRHPASIEELRKGLANRRNFETRLLAENLIFLEDNAPSARVRAFDWLRSRGHAPAGYDPLGPPRQRRDALEKALSAPPSITAPAAPKAVTGAQP